jgi:hypothetical protein
MQASSKVVAANQLINCCSLVENMINNSCRHTCFTYNVFPIALLSLCIAMYM